MSHIVTIKTEIRDPVAIASACRRLKLEQPIFGEAKLFSGTKTGWQVSLPEWRYPVVCDVATGQIDFDNYQGRWGKQHLLDRFLQTYAAEKCHIEARKKGPSITEQTLPNGSIKLTVHVGGAA